MTDISTTKTIEIWDNEFNQYYKIYPQFDSDLVAFLQREEGVSNAEEHMIEIPAGAIGVFVKALHEVAQDVIENTREDDAEG